MTPDPSALAGVLFTLPMYPTTASRTAAVGWLSRCPTPAAILSTEQRWLAPVQDVTVLLGSVDACPEAGPVAGRAAGPELEPTWPRAVLVCRARAGKPGDPVSLNCPGQSRQS